MEDAILSKFNDVIETGPGWSLLLQTKCEGWAGEFIDLTEDAQLTNGSVVRAICLEPKVIALKDLLERSECYLYTRAKILQLKGQQFVRS